MAGYSGTPLWKKLGYRDGVRAFAEGAPPGYARLLGLPGDVRVSWGVTAGRGAAFVHLFCRRRDALAARLTKLRRLLATDGVIWVSWPKKASGVATNLTGYTIRACALPLGLVDVKVCAVDATWSGLKLMIRKSER